MQPPQDNNIAYKWFSYFIVFAFAYYWMFTIGMIFLPKKMGTVSGRQAGIYGAFARQNWRLFASTKLYNRKLNLVIRDKANHLQTDTIDLVNYSISQKRKYAPFNNYEDAIDKLLYQQMNALEVQLLEKKAFLKTKFPNKPDSFYMLQSSALVDLDSLQQVNIQNLTDYGKYVLKQTEKNLAGKEFQLIQLHKFIPPQIPVYSLPGDISTEPIFISSFKSF